MFDKRLTLRLINYWRLLRKDQRMPHFAQFNPSAIEDIWPRCFGLRVMRAQGGRQRYRMSHVGADIAKAYGRRMTGQEVSAYQRSFPGTNLLRRVNEAVADPAVMEDAGHFHNERQSIIKYRACLLPFGSVRDGVTDVVIGVSWREF